MKAQLAHEDMSESMQQTTQPHAEVAGACLARPELCTVATKQNPCKKNLHETALHLPSTIYTETSLRMRMVNNTRFHSARTKEG